MQSPKKIIPASLQVLSSRWWMLVICAIASTMTLRCGGQPVKERMDAEMRSWMMTL